jgi:hypothetical protein
MCFGFIGLNLKLVNNFNSFKKRLQDFGFTMKIQNQTSIGYYCMIKNVITPPPNYNHNIVDISKALCQ